MNKLIKRLDDVVQEEDSLDSADISYEFLKAYPKLRAVVEAAQSLRTPINEDFSVNDRMQAVVDLDKALAALKEDI